MFPNRINKIIGQAIELAKENNAKFRLAAIACDRKGNVISTGVNSSKSHPYQSKLALKNGHEDQIGLHAEVACLLKSRRKIHSLIVVRLLKNGNTAMAKPCKICREAIRISKVKNVIYSTNNGFSLEKMA